MPIRPGPIGITIGGNPLLADSITQSYDIEFFDRIEFDHEKLKSAPLSTGTVPQIVTLLGGKPAEIIIDCALTGMIGGSASYVPRPLTPNAFPADYNNIKQRFNITKFIIVGGQSAESSSPEIPVNNIFPLRILSRDSLAQFQNRIASFSQIIPYETLLAAQSDNILALYFTTGITFTAPEIIANNCLITDFTITHEYVIPNISGGFDIFKGFNCTLEIRSITAASSV